MGFLVDTCIWIDIERGALAPADVASVTKDEPVYLSPVTIAELKFGVENAPSPDLRQRRLAALARLKSRPLLWIDDGTGEIFGDLAAQLKKNGKQHQHRVQDLWLASQAVQHGFSFLTRNEKDFADIPGLQLLLLKLAKDIGP